MQILINEPLKNYTSYKIGGNTPKMYIVNQITDLDEISDNDLQNTYILGNGTNILVSDNGLTKPVIKMDFKHFLLNELEQTLTIGAGFDLNEVIRLLAEKGYKGLNHLAGIPGSIGGAITMNASASHGSILDYLINVEAYAKQAKLRRNFNYSECEFGFRSSIFQNSNWIITFVRFRLEKGNKDELIKSYKKNIDSREKNYPMILPSAGCWFKRDWGGKDIIKKIGMSGAIKGGAVVSPMFPAFILNANNATTKDVYSLAKEIQDKAKAINENMPFEIITWGEI